MSKLGDFLESTPKKEVAKPAKTEKKKDVEIPENLKIELADGSVIKRDALEFCEMQRNQREYVMRNTKGQMIRRKKPTPLAVITETPAWLIPPPPPEDPDKGLTEKQKEYKHNVIKSKDLRESTKKVTRSNNRLGLHRYIFWGELVANKNGLLYYSIPTLVNIVFLIINIAAYNFLANVAFTVLVLANLFLIRYTLKNYTNPLAKAGIIILILLLDAGLIYAGRYVPGLYEQIYLPFAIKLFLIVLGLYYFFGFYAGILKAYYDDLKADDGNVVKILSGPPRVGKTALAVQLCFVLAQQKWRQLQYLYWKTVGQERKILKRNDSSELLERRRILNSYSFYTMSPCIPCLFSNIGIEDKVGRRSHVVTLDHMKGLVNLPIYPVILYDEIGASITMDEGTNRTGKEKPVDISDMMRLGGQFLNWTVICTEQDYNHVFIDVRRVVGQNMVITSREWRCKPKLLYGIYKLLYTLKTDGLDRKIKKQPVFTGFMAWFEKFVHSIGFAVTRFGYRNNTQTEGEISHKDSDGNISTVKATGSRWIPVRNICNYDHEAMRQLYPSYFDKEIHAELHKSLRVDGRLKASYQYVSSTTALEEKRAAIWDEINKIA